MNHRRVHIWLVVAVLLMLPMLVQAQFTYTTNNGAITITGYTGTNANVIIPDEINGYPVTTIAEYAFSPVGSGGCSSVVIPDSVTNMGMSVFYGSTSLTNVSMSTNMTILPQETFGFSGLTSFTFPQGITNIGGGAFDNCLYLTNVSIPAGVQSIGDYAFNDCETMTSVVIPDSVTSLGDWSYEGCYGVTNLIIGSGITTIPANAFSYCTSLPTVSIPDSVTNIGSTYYGGPFSGCFALTNITYGSGADLNIALLRYPGATNLAFITVSSNNPVLSSLDGAVFDKNHTTLFQCPLGKAGSYSVPATVTNIWTQAFVNCSQLTQVIFDSSIYTNNLYIFNGCSSITNITLLDGVTNIPPYLFYPCVNLGTITASPSNRFYSSVNGVLYDKLQKKLVQYPYNGPSSYTVPNGVSSIANAAFYYCIGLTNIILPEGLTNIGYLAFFNCSGLTTISIPQGITYLGDEAFESCTHLMSVLIPKSVTSIGSATFDGCTALPNLTIPNGLVSIGSYAFADCTSLTSVTIPNSVTNIGDYAFTYCLCLSSAYFMGSAFSADRTVFLNPLSGGLKVYYLPGSSGWNPQVEQNSASFGVRSNQFGFGITGTDGMSIVVEACTNVTDSAWSPVSTITISNGSSYFGDPQWTNYPSRFYRLSGLTFGGVPAVLWNPLMQTTAPQFGLHTNGFGFNITGTEDIPILVEAATNLNSGTWTALQSCYLTNGLLYFSDPQWTNYPARFYRIRSP
jgi:hypothetical protein